MPSKRVTISLFLVVLLMIGITFLLFPLGKEGAAPSDLPEPPEVLLDIPEDCIVPVFYGTDRNREDWGPKGQLYGGQRGELEVGTLLVSIPSQHEIGELERPSIFFRRQPTTWKGWRSSPSGLRTSLMTA